MKNRKILSLLKILENQSQKTRFIADIIRFEINSETCGSNHKNRKLETIDSEIQDFADNLAKITKNINDYYRRNGHV